MSDGDVAGTSKRCRRGEAGERPGVGRLVALAIALLATLGQAWAQDRVQEGGEVTFADVGPVLMSRCAYCHMDNGLMGRAPERLRLSSYDATVRGGERMVVVPGHPEASELVRRIRGQAWPRMPFDGPPFLDAEQIRLIETWVAQGARDAAGQPAPLPVGARLRLHGRLTSRWALDDLPLDVGPGARLDDAPGPGDYVEVRGRLGEGGRVVVERLRRR